MAAGGRPERPQELEDQPDVADPDRRRRGRRPRRSDQSASQMTSASATGPPAPRSSTPTWVNSRSRPGVGVSYRKTGPDMLTRQGRAGHSPRLGVGADDAGGELGAEADRRRPGLRHLEQLGDDPRAALALVELGELEDRASASAA